MTKLIEVKHASVIYSERKSFFRTEQNVAIKDINFDVYKGETLGVIGRNGVGKSTLLRLLAGIIKPNQGEVLLHAESISLMALGAGFDANLSGRSNAIISGMLLGHSQKFMLSLLDKIQEFSGLNDFFEKPIKIYSSGMRSRLGFSIAMFASPEILLIDETLAVGDSAFRQKAEKTIVEKVKSDLTVVLVSHSEQDIAKVSDRVVWIDRGMVRREGTAEEIFPEYRFDMELTAKKVFTELLWLNDDYIYIFDKPEVKDDKVYLGLTFISKNAESIDKIVLLNSHGEEVNLAFSEVIESHNENGVDIPVKYKLEKTSITLDEAYIVSIINKNKTNQFMEVLFRN